MVTGVASVEGARSLASGPLAAGVWTIGGAVVAAGAMSLLVVDGHLRFEPDPLPLLLGAVVVGVGILTATRLLSAAIAGLALLAMTGALTVAVGSVSEAGAATGLRAVLGLLGAGCVLVGGLAAVGIGPRTGADAAGSADPVGSDPPPSQGAVAMTLAGMVVAGSLAAALALGLPGLSGAERAWCLARPMDNAIASAGDALGIDTTAWGNRPDDGLLDDRGFVRACRLGHDSVGR